MTLEDTLKSELINVYPEAEDFLRTVKEAGKFDKVHIYDNGSPLCQSFHLTYGKKIWAVRELEPYADGGDWKEVGIALDRKDPAIYFSIRTMQMGASMSLALETGFQLKSEKAYFDKLTEIFKKIFIEGEDAYYFLYDDEGRKLTLKLN